jgi:hypothetical protein
VQYTIESRQLSKRDTERARADAESRQILIEASDADDAITQFIRQSECELVSLTKPLTGRESFATIKKDESVFLVRVYAA